MTGFAADGAAEGPGWRVRFDARCPLLLAGIDSGGVLLAGASVVRARVRVLPVAPALELDERNLECILLGQDDRLRRLALRLRLVGGVRTRAREVVVSVEPDGVAIPIDLAIPRLPWLPDVTIEVGLREAPGARLEEGAPPLDRPGDAYAVTRDGRRLLCRLELEPWAQPLVRVFAAGGVHGFRLRLRGPVPPRARATLRLAIGGPR